MVPIRPAQTEEPLRKRNIAGEAFRAFSHLDIDGELRFSFLYEKFITFWQWFDRQN